MQAGLFRHEAAEHQRTKLLGDTSLALPVSCVATTGFLVLCAAALVAFAAFGSYARREHVSGFLLSTRGIAKVVPPRPGVITAVHVAEGQIVEQGAPLLTINAEQNSDLGAGADQAKLQVLREQQKRLREQVVLQRERAGITAAGLHDAIAALSVEISALQRVRQTQTERIEIARQQLSAVMEGLAKGYVSQNEWKKRQDNYLAQRQAEEALARDSAARHGEREQRHRALQQLPNDTAEQVARLTTAIADIDMRLLETEEHRAYLLTAPMAGRVSALQTWVGKTVEPSIPQMSIVPEGAELRAELLVSARAIGFVAVGQPVRLSYNTFPYQQFGFAAGTVETVSHTLLKPDELVGPVLLKEPSYRVRVALDRQDIDTYGRQIPLQPDMQIEADILFEQRSLLAWLLDPLRAAMRGAR